MTSSALPKFSFDTVFDGDSETFEAAPRPKRLYTAHEVERIRAEALAEGERAAVTRAEHEAALALQAVAVDIGRAMGILAQAVHVHRIGAAELALAAAGKIAGAALARFPEAPAQAALEALAREIEAAPRLMVRASPELEGTLQASLGQVVEACGYAGQVTVKADPALPPAAFVFDWGEGQAAFDPAQAAARVAAALETALAAEGLHGEPLINPSENPDA